MSTRLIALAVLAAVTSPTAIAAVLVILSRPHPVRLLSAYTIASFVTSVLVGVAIVAGLTETQVVAPDRRKATPIFDIAIGMLILLSAAWLRSERSTALRRRAAERRAQRKARRGDKPSRSSQILTGGSIGLVGALGVAMHLPGLLYLAALAEITHADLSTGRTVLTIVVFNIIMLAPIELPLLAYIVVPQKTERTLRTVNSYIQAHRAEGLMLLSVVAGGYLIASGVVELAR